MTTTATDGLSKEEREELIAAHRSAGVRKAAIGLDVTYHENRIKELTAKLQQGEAADEIIDNGKVRTLGRRANGETYIESERSLTAADRAASNPATARPWHTKDGKGVMLGSSGKSDSVFIIGRDLSWLAELPAGAMSEANAALIVQAVNNFDALRDTLTTIREDARNAWLLMRGSVGPIETVARIAEQADAALKAAGGEG